LAHFLDSVEIKMHHLQVNAIPAGRMQFNALSLKLRTSAI